MKIKFLSILMAVALAVAFTSCGNNQNASSGESASEKSENVDEPKGPTGDVAKDAKMMAEEGLNLMKSFKTGDDYKEFEKKTEELEKKYEDFYKAKGDEELKKFQEELKNVTSTPEFKEKLMDAMIELNKNLPEGTHAGMTDPESIPE